MWLARITRFSAARDAGTDVRVQPAAQASTSERDRLSRMLMKRGRIRMARDDREIRLPHRGETVAPDATPSAEPSLGELFKRLSTDTSELIRHEMSLAKVEMREAGATLARDATKIGVAVALALAGVLALGAFAIVGLGDLFNNYWLAALVVGVLFLAIGGYLAKNALDDVKRRGLKPQKTVETLREDASWVKQEGRELKRDLTR
jgi:uncharacterized membrane protein YqjE